MCLSCSEIHWFLKYEGLWKLSPRRSMCLCLALRSKDLQGVGMPTCTGCKDVTSVSELRLPLLLLGMSWCSHTRSGHRSNTCYWIKVTKPTAHHSPIQNTSPCPRASCVFRAQHFQARPTWTSPDSSVQVWLVGWQFQEAYRESEPSQRCAFFPGSFSNEESIQNILR